MDPLFSIKQRKKSIKTNKKKKSALKGKLYNYVELVP